MVYYYSGWVLQRDFINWIDGVGYDLTIGRQGGRKSYVVHHRETMSCYRENGREATRFPPI